MCVHLWGITMRDTNLSNNVHHSRVKVECWDRYGMKDEMNFYHRRRYRSSKVTRSHAPSTTSPSRADKPRVFVFFYLPCRSWHGRIHRQVCGTFVRRVVFIPLCLYLELLFFTERYILHTLFIIKRDIRLFITIYILYSIFLNILTWKYFILLI